MKNYSILFISPFVITLLLLSSCGTTQKDRFYMQEKCLSYEESLKDNCLLNGCTIEGVFYSPITNSCLYQKYSDNNNGHEIIIYLSLNEVGTNKVIKTYSAVANGEKSDKLMEFNEIVESYQ